MAKDLNFLSDEHIQKIRESKIKSALSGIREKIGELDINVEQEIKEQPVIEAKPRYGKLDLADHARKVYKENVRTPVEFEDEEQVTSSLPSIQYNARALARSLVGIRNGGSVGKSVALAGPNGGNVGIGCNTTTVAVMSVEEYEDHISKLFIKEEEAEIKDEPQLLVEGDSPVDKLEEELLEMSDHTWQAIDLVMRRIAKEHEMTPKQLHKDFKSKNGMIPDDWAKMHEDVEQVGWMPLDEMVRVNQQGQVFEVSFLFRGGRQRLKFFWPEVGYPSHEDMQDACHKFWPGARLLAYYPVHDSMSASSMVMLPAMKENYELLPDNLWEFMSEEDSEIYDTIAAEEGEPVSAVYLTEDEDEFEMEIADHDTGEVRVVVFGEGLKQARKNIGMDPNKASCWDGYKAKGTKKKGGKEVPNCVKEEDETPKVETKYKKVIAKQEARNEKEQARAQKKYGISEDMSGMSQKSGDKRSTDSGAGMTSKGVAKYNSRTGGNLKTAVTTPPSKLKAGSKAAGRRKSFCARSRGWNGERGKAARKRWNC